MEPPQRRQQVGAAAGGNAGGGDSRRRRCRRARRTRRRRGAWGLPRAGDRDPSKQRRVGRVPRRTKRPARASPTRVNGADEGRRGDPALDRGDDAGGLAPVGAVDWARARRRPRAPARARCPTAGGLRGWRPPPAVVVEGDAVAAARGRHQRPATWRAMSSSRGGLALPTRARRRATAVSERPSIVAPVSRAPDRRGRLGRGRSLARATARRRRRAGPSDRHPRRPVSRGRGTPRRAAGCPSRAGRP